MRRKSFLWGGSNPVTRLSPSFPTAYCVPSKCQQFSTLTMMMIMMFICYSNVKTQKTKLGSATTDGQNFFPSYNVVRQQLSHCIDCFLSQVPKCPSSKVIFFLFLLWWACIAWSVWCPKYLKSIEQFWFFWLLLNNTSLAIALKNIARSILWKKFRQCEMQQCQHCVETFLPIQSNINEV